MDGLCYKQIYNAVNIREKPFPSYNAVNIREKPFPSYDNHMLGALCYTCKLYTCTNNIDLRSVQ